jgi:phosphoglycolate phosphatase
VGSGAAKLVSRALPPEKYSDELAADCLQAFRQAYQRNWNVKTRPYAGVSELLDALTAKGIAMAMLTNKPQHFAELCVQAYFSKWNFAIILGQRDGVPMKPDPGGTREVLRCLDVPSEACVYMGDSDVDMQTALNADLLPVGAAWGFRSEEELRAAGAAKVIGQPTDLLSLMG